MAGSRSSELCLRSSSYGYELAVNPFLDLVQTVSKSVALARSGRVFHPIGSNFAGTLTVEESDSPSAHVLHGEWPVFVRASKAIGTPGNWPDIHGLALRVGHDAGPVDLLFATVARQFPYILVPSASWSSHPYSTFLRYAADGEHVLLRLDPEQPDRAAASGNRSIEQAVAETPLTFALMESAGRSWRSIGRLTVEAASDGRAAFDPIINEHPRLRHSRLFAKIRVRAYAGSREGRGARVAQLTGESEGVPVHARTE